jgi:hypothetical protein
MSKLKIIENRLVETHEHRRGIGFEGAEPEPYDGYTHKGKMWLPDFAFAQWVHGKPIEEISLRGSILKQDGTPSQHRGDITYQTVDYRWFSSRSRLAPQWLLDLFADSPHTSPE